MQIPGGAHLLGYQILYRETAEGGAVDHVEAAEVDVIDHVAVGPHGLFDHPQRLTAGRGLAGQQGRVGRGGAVFDTNLEWREMNDDAKICI